MNSIIARAKSMVNKDLLPECPQNNKAIKGNKDSMVENISEIKNINTLLK
ncbi:hypothetical protein [Chryseobacterium paludis]|nr:hypothetical protein [Chryseobacterium paludis]